MKNIAIGVLISLAAVVASAQQSAAPAAGSEKMDHDACMKMGSAHASESQAKHDASLKAIQADLAAARTATGEKKVAALEAALNKLIALHGEMHSAGMAEASNHGTMECCAGKEGAAKASMSAKKMDCCADHEGSAAAAPPAKK